MPTAPSSARVARSPCSSCTRRETTTYDFSNRIDSHTIGTAVAATTRPSGQYMCSSTVVITVTWRMLMTRNSRPKPLNRRIADRSVVDPREQLAGLPLRVEAHRQQLEALVEVVPDRGLEREHGVGLQPAAHPDQERLEHAEAEREQPERQHAAEVVVGDRPVDQRLGHQRDRDASARPRRGRPTP